MLLTNHTLSGVLLGLTIDNPAILAPTAVASHLALDMTPHFGFDRPKSIEPTFQERAFIVLGSLDFTLSIAVTAAACLMWPARSLNIIIGVIGAALPDLTYIPIIVFGRKLMFKIPGYKPMIDFFVRIQWYEKPLGLITEAVWATLMITLLLNYHPYG